MERSFPDTWKLLPLENCMAAIIDYRGKTPEKTSVGIPLITAKIVKGGRINEVQEYIAPEDYDTWMRRGLPKPGDIVMTTEAPLGEIAQLDGRKVALAQRLITLRGKAGLLDNSYLKFLMQSEFVQRQLHARATGTTVLGIKQSELRKIALAIPPLPEQKAIAHILGTLDDKIELNQQMNRNLEAIASAIFKSWFVDFDPVRAKMEGRQPAGIDTATAALFPASFEDSPLGEIPKGWKVGTVEDMGEVICGKTPPTNNPENYGKEMPFITIPDMHGRVFALETSKYLSVKGIQTQLNKTLPAYSICVSCIATPGLVVITSQPSQTNQQINSIIPTDKSTIFYCYFTLRRLADEIRARGSGGSVFSNLNKRQFAALPVLIPPQELISKYQQLVEALFQKLLSHEQENRAIATIRDTLLPKLMSGEIRVKEAEKILEDVA